MNNNQNPQPPPNQGQQVPAFRQDEIMNELRALRDQNQQLRGQIDYLSASQRQQIQQPQQADQYKSPFEESVDRALTEKFQRMIQGTLDPLVNQFKQQIGYVVDRTDEVAFQTQYGNERYKKYLDKVEDIRSEYQRRGQYIPREEALRIAYFEETGKKPTPQPQEQAPQQPQPKFDPFFGTMVGPDGKPIQEGMEMEQQQQQQMPTNQAPGWQQFPQQQPPQQQMQQQPMPSGFAPQPNQNHPMTNPFGQLPDQGMNNPYPGNPQQSGHLSLDVYASDNDLKAFEDKYGDVPL